MQWVHSESAVGALLGTGLLRMREDLLTAEAGLSALRAISEPTRLRILLLLGAGELTVKDFTQILGQSQPRISRHLKLLHDAGLLARVQEGSRVYFRLTDEPAQRGVVEALRHRFDTGTGDFKRDRERADAARQEHFDRAQAFFARHAGQWDRLRALHADEGEVERRITALLARSDVGDLLVDMGTGTGRILQLLARDFRRAIGIDTNVAMLGYARAGTQGSEFSHVQLRRGDICHLAIADGTVDTAVMHQVLHYLADPAPAIREAARILRPGGRLLIVDFSAHAVERLREEYAHQRLGFSRQQIATWLKNAGLALTKYENLPPAPATSTDGLTVSFWLATAPASDAAGDAGERQLENIG